MTPACTPDRVISQADVIFKSNLTCQDNVITSFATASDTDLAADQIMTANFTVVSNHDLVVDLRAFTDRCRAITASIDRDRGAEFNVALNLHVTQLSGGYMFSLFLPISKTICAESTTSMNHDPVVDLGVLVQGDIGVDLAVVAND